MISRSLFIKLRFATLFTFALTLLLILSCGLLYRYPRVSGDISALYPSASPELTDYQTLSHLFGATTTDTIIITLPLVTQDVLDSLETLTDELQTLSGVENVVSPSLGLGNITPPLRVTNPPTPYARFLLTLSENLTDQERDNLHAQINKTISSYPSFSPIRIGPFSFSQEATNALAQDSTTSTLLCLISLLIGAVCLQKSVQQGLLLLVPPLMSVGIILLSLALCNIPLGPISQLAPPLLLGLASSYAGYAAFRIKQSQQFDDKEYFRLARSLLLASSTSSIGFFSLITLNAKGIFDFALLTGIGSLAAFIISAALVPLFFSPQKQSIRSIQLRPKSQIITYQRILSWIIIPCSLLAVIPLLSFSVSTNPLDFIPSGSTKHADLVKAGELFPGSSPLSVVYHRNTQEPFSETEWELLRTLMKKIEELPGVHYVTGAPKFRDYVGAWRERGIDLLESPEVGPPPITTPDLKHTRIVAETEKEGAELITLTEEIKAILPTSSQWTVSSREYLLSKQSENLVIGMIESVFLAVLIVGVLFALVFRSLSIALIGVLPSLCSVFLILGTAVAVHPTLDLGAATVAAGALGMISDNSFHFLLLWNARGKNRSAILQATRESFTPFVLTATLLVIGFLPLTVSSLLPVRKFGILLSVSMVVGVLLNLTLLPWLTNLLAQEPVESTNEE